MSTTAPTVVALLLCAPLASADPLEHSTRWRAARAALEASIVAGASPERLRAAHEQLASEPHVAGTPGDARTIERLATLFRDAGLATEVHEFWAYLPAPGEASVTIVAPETVALPIREDPVDGDPWSADPGVGHAWNAYAGSGDVTAEVVYANYGTREDFQRLRELGIDARGRIVLARYGGNFRGFKAKFAEAAGAAGLIIYTDPADAGYVRGIEYPEGGFANGSQIERGSLNTLDYPGDPLTPGREATRDAERLDPAAAGLHTIPVQPIGGRAAGEILTRMRGPGVPPGWQGGLPCAYRLTGGPDLRVRLVVRTEHAVRRSANVLARIPGTVWPEQSVIIGAHHDAWTFGAGDPLSGTIAVIEAGRLLADAARQGQPPARSIIFAAWGAEEMGLIGSTEWVEAHRDRLVAGGIAYINLDMAGMGTVFGGSAAPSIQPVIVDATRAVPQPGSTGTVLESWARGGREPSLGEIGGGSDHVAFYFHAGVPSAGFGGGGSPGTSYHSAYDNLAWYHKVVGDDYESSRMVARTAALVAARLANEPLLPFDPARTLAGLRTHLLTISRLGEKTGFLTNPGLVIDPASPTVTDRTSVEIAELDAAALAAQLAVRRAVERARSAEARGALDAAATARANELLLGLERAWLAQDGLPGRPWYRNIYMGPDATSGYAAWPLPALRGAIERSSREELAVALRQLRAAVERQAALAAELHAVIPEERSPVTAP